MSFMKFSLHMQEKVVVVDNLVIQWLIRIFATWSSRSALLE